MAMHPAHPMTRLLEGFAECVPEISSHAITVPPFTFWIGFLL